MQISNKVYQEKAIGQIVNAVVELLPKTEISNRLVVFQSPTGSGKTYMISEVIEELISDFEDLDVCYLWISIGKGELHKQSQRALKNIFGEYPQCSIIEQEFHGGRAFIKRNEVGAIAICTPILKFCNCLHNESPST